MSKSAVIFIVLALFFIPRMAAAHVFPDQASPRVGSTVSVSPGLVQISYDSNLKPGSTITVCNAAGRMIDNHDCHVDPSNPDLMEVSIPKNLPAGKYRVTWTAVAGDGHETQGDYTFTIK